MEDFLLYAVIFGPIVAGPILLLSVRAKNKVTLYWKWFLGIVILLEVLGMGSTFMAESANPRNVISGMGYLATAFILHPLVLIGTVGMFVVNMRAQRQ